MTLSRIITGMLLVAAIRAGSVVAQDVTCPEGFQLIEDQCFQFVIGSETWSASEENCQAMGSHLAVLSDCGLLKEVVRRIYAHGLQENDFWIGAHDLSGTGNWLWIDGEVVEMGMPYWGTTDGEFEPRSGYPVAFLSQLDRHYFYGGSSGGIASAICQAPPIPATKQQINSLRDD